MKEMFIWNKTAMSFKVIDETAYYWDSSESNWGIKWSFINAIIIDVVPLSIVSSYIFYSDM
jgi:hypothetical protein